MALNTVEDTPIDIGRGITDLRRMVEDQQAQLTEIRQDSHTQFAEIHELLQELTLQNHRQPLNQNRNCIKGFAHN
ncbi:hypothetical protein RHMOL_Rhmol05G0158000 [Rhododendron molle]|uniref:Uncharacterized protein n=1 Tax=Rhododendron molle TaxID=49168 RepID=A0ACC0NQG0_RHOML|nr:hypothetical protein RHMOL_Rhmol05G0158000 [Rhododendron molle]